MMAKRPHKPGTLMADLQLALEMGAESDQIEHLLNEVQGLFTRIETRRLKIERQADAITKLLEGRKDLRLHISELGPTKRSAKAKRARQKMLQMIRAIDEHRVADYVVLRAEVEEIVGYRGWLEAARQHEAEALKTEGGPE